jgi:7-carboxy-7-deazaguanine synthase
MSLENEAEMLPIVEEFYTIQGEGFHTGKPAYFIRLGGCDVCCSWCDVKVSWDSQIHKLGSVKNIAANALAYPAKSVVVTGGEPMLYNLDGLTDQLRSMGMKCFLETSGSSEISGNWDWICLSPKPNKEALPSFLQKAHELKVVIDKKLDFSFAEKYAGAVHSGCLLYLQPEWSSRAISNPAVINYVKQNPRWNLSLQTHKFINIP